MKEYRPSDGDCGNMIWPKDRLMEALRQECEVCIEFPTEMTRVYDEHRGVILEIHANSFIFSMSDSIAQGVAPYSSVYSFEMIQAESKPPEPETLAAGMWDLPPMANNDFGQIVEQKVARVLPVLIPGDREDNQARQIVDAHNAVVRRLHEINAWRALAECDLPIRMSKDGLEIGDNQKPDYGAGIQKAGDMLSVYGFKMTMPDRIILEYGDDPDIVGRRIIITDDSVVIEDSKAGEVIL